MPIGTWLLNNKSVENEAFTYGVCPFFTLTSVVAVAEPCEKLSCHSKTKRI